MSDRVYYAIGDVHGEADRLRALHRHIKDVHAREHAGAPMTLVHLGDIIDRGPDPCAAVDAILALEAEADGRDDIEIVTLLGNHERMLLDAQETPEDSRELWLFNGGDATEESYNRVGRGPVDPAHVAWMDRLPSIKIDQDARLIFVHAGVSATDFPNENIETYLWTRRRSFFQTEDWSAPALEGMTVVHGHTPTANNEPDIAGDGRRINIDTGAVYGGPLTALVLAPGAEPTFFFV